jgi:hypothetical protein
MFVNSSKSHYLYFKHLNTFFSENRSVSFTRRTKGSLPQKRMRTLAVVCPNDCCKNLKFKTILKPSYQARPVYGIQKFVQKMSLEWGIWFVHFENFWLTESPGRIIDIKKIFWQHSCHFVFLCMKLTVTLLSYLLINNVLTVLFIRIVGLLSPLLSLIQQSVYTHGYFADDILQQLHKVQNDVQSMKPLRTWYRFGTFSNLLLKRSFVFVVCDQRLYLRFMV